MKPMRRMISAVGIAMGGSALLLAVALTGSWGQSIGKADTPLKVAETLDCLLQPKFQTFDGRFGVSERTEELCMDDYFQTRLRIETAQDRKYHALAEAAHRDYFVMFLHCAQKPAAKYRDKADRRDRLQSTKEVALPLPDGPSLDVIDAKRGAPATRERLRNLLYAQGKQWQKACVSELPRLRRGERVNADSGDWLLAMRPVRAVKRECLGCHTSAKKGDTLGVMVYAVSRKATLQ